MTDNSVDFTSLVEPGDQITLRGTLVSLTAQIIFVSLHSLTLANVTFETSESNVSYTLFQEQVKISTTKKSKGSSLRIDYGPVEMGFPDPADPDVYVEGSIPQFEAVDKVGGLLTFRGVVAGDLLRIVGSQVEYEVVENLGTQLSLAAGLPSSLDKAGFEIRSGAAKAFKELNGRLSTFTTSPNLLSKNNFDVDLTELDNALTAAVIPGQNFASSRNRARTIIAGLLSILTDSPKRASEYIASIPIASDNLSGILLDFTVTEIAAVGKILDAFLERKYDRAVDLLQTGRISDFYATTAETGSFGGAVLNASRKVVNDLPSQSSLASDVDKLNNVSVSSQDSYNANTDFTDYEDSPDDIGE